MPDKEDHPVTLHPGDQVLVSQPVWIESRDIQFLIQLYMPFLGTLATSLYLALYAQLRPKSYQSDPIILGDLLLQLNCGMRDLDQAKKRLEGIGLLRTFQASDPTSPVQAYRLELQAPVAPDQFFKDALLASLLRSQIGPEALDKLRRFYLPAPRPQRMTELTTAFDQTFDVPVSMQTYRRRVEEEAQMVQKAKPGRALNLASDLDWQLLEGLLTSQFIAPQAITDRVKQAISDLHRLYGYSEKELAQYVIYAADLTTGLIDEEELLTLSLQVMDKKVPSGRSQDFPASPAKGETMEETSSQNGGQDPKKPDLQADNQASLSPLQRLIHLAETMVPFDFLTSIYQQKNSFMPKADRELLKDLLEKSQLSPGVINILMHYVLVVEGNRRLNRNFVEAIANEWGQIGISSAQEALQHVRNRENMGKIREQRQAAKKQTALSKKPLPQWAKQDQEVKETPSDQANLQALQAQIAKLKTSNPNQEGGQVWKR